MQTSDYEARVRALEAEGCTRSDAQAIVDAEDLQTAPAAPLDTFTAVMIAEGADGYATNNRDRYLAAWQYLIDTGTCWQLQGWFGRTAAALIKSGDCRPANRN